MAVRKRRNIKKQRSKANISFSNFWRVLKNTTLLIAFIGVLGFSSVYSIVKMNQFLSRPIERIVINGDFEYTKAENVETLIRGAADQSFVKEHLASIRKTLVASPWIENASLTRRWPNTLEVFVEEQKPIARWGDRGFVNFRGELVKTRELKKIQHLPLLFGKELDAAKVMYQYKTLTLLLLNNGLAIDSLNKNTLGVWQLQLSNGWELILGRNSLAEKVRLVSYVLDQKILLVNDAIKTIDMRYENGFAIGWDESVKTILDDQHENKTNVGEPS